MQGWNVQLQSKSEWDVLASSRRRAVAELASLSVLRGRVWYTKTRTLARFILMDYMRGRRGGAVNYLFAATQKA